MISADGTVATFPEGCSRIGPRPGDNRLTSPAKGTPECCPIDRLDSKTWHPDAKQQAIRPYLKSKSLAHFTKYQMHTERGFHERRRVPPSAWERHKQHGP